MDAVDFIIRLRAWTCLKARYSLRDYRNVLMFFVFNLVKILWLWSFDLLIRTCLCVNLLRIALESCSKISLRESVQIRSFSWSVFSPNTWKYGPEKTPYLGTLHAVFNDLVLLIYLLNKIISDNLLLLTNKSSVSICHAIILAILNFHWFILAADLHK